MRKGFRMRNWKRAVSILLVFMMVLTTVYSDLGGAWVDVKSVQAEEDDPQTDSTQEAPSEDTSEDASSETSRMITLSVGEGDARSLQLTTAGTFDNAVSVNYGQTFAIQVQAEEEQQVDIYYASKDISEENIGNIDKWSQYDSDSRESCPSAVGDYYIGYKIGEQVHLSNQYGFSIKKATIGAPSTVTIDDDYNVSFSAVTSTTDGVAIEESSVTYELKLLKAAAEGEEASVIAQTSLPEPATAETPWNVASQIRTAGEGSYYVTVTPVLSEQARESYTVPETSTAQSESVSFADTTIPVIESYTANQEQFQLQAKVKDSESSVVAYVFTTKTSVDDIGDDEWQAITGNTAGEVAEVSATPTASGTYYFYAKDAAGNKVSSVAGEAIEVTKVTLKEIYEDNATQATQRDLAVFGSGEYTLPTPTREGFQFLGWKKTLESDETIDSITPAQEDITVIATWKDIREKVTIQPVDDETVTVTDSSVQKTYDGTALTLISSLANVPEDTEVSYQWYKNGVALDGKTDSTINVKNVSGSGTYTVVATITKNDAPFTFGSNEIVVTINPVQLTVKAGDHAISYLSDAPTNENYTYTVTGFVNNETEDVLNVDGLEYACTYQKGNAAGTECAITPAGLSANHGNYTFDYQPGTLRVNVKAVSVAQPNGVNLTLDSASLVYDGTEKRPNVTVTDEQLGDDSALSATRDYTVAYTDNVNASSNKATVTVTFCGNYTGTLKQTFDIEKATPVISVEVEADHEYDNVAPTVTPTITNSSGEAPTYRYYKVVGENVTALSSAPRAAGNYQIEASLKEQANYNAVTSDRVFYTIRPRDITLESPDGNWPYDEGEHLTSAIYPDVSGKLQRYKMTGSFIGSDGFQSVTVAHE